MAHPAALHPARAFRKSRRAFDVAFSVFVLVLTAPLLALAVLALRLESPGAAIFRQRRMGLNGRLFELVKLRGMYVDAPERFPESTRTRTTRRRAPATSTWTTTRA